MYKKKNGAVRRKVGEMSGRDRGHVAADEQRAELGRNETGSLEGWEGVEKCGNAEKGGRGAIVTGHSTYRVHTSARSG